MSNHETERSERQRVRETRDGVLEAVGTLVLSVLCGLAVFFGLGAWYFAAKTVHAIGMLQAAGVVFVGCLLVAGGVYAFFKV